MESINNKQKAGLVIMASGLGKRFGGNKLVEPLNSKPLIKWVIDSTEGLFSKRIVVTRSSQVLELCNSMGVDCIIHEFPGRNDTVRLGLGKIAADMDYCFFMQGDQPLISRDSIQKLIQDAFDKGDKIIRAGYGDTVGSPMGFPKVYFDELMSLPEGKGGNFIAKKYPSCVDTVKVSHEYELWDVDSPDDMDRIKAVLNITEIIYI